MKNNSIKYYSLRKCLAAALCTGFLIAAEVYAQEVPDGEAEPPTNEGTPGTDEDLSRTELQDNTASGVLNICEDLNDNNSSTGVQARLRVTCTSMVANSDDDLGRGLTERGLDAAYQNVAAEENFAPTRIATNAASGQISTIAARLTKLRGGSFGLVAGQGGYNPKYALVGLPSVYGGAAGDTDSPLMNRFSGFVTGHGGFGEVDPTERENGADFDHKGVTAGLDARVLNNLIFGVAGTYSAMDLDFNSSRNVAGGNVESDSYGVIVYGTYYLGGFYLDGMFGYSWSDYDIDRRVFLPSNNASIDAINTSATASPDGESRTLSLQAGYNFNTRGLSFGPYAKVAHQRVEVDQYSESGADELNMLIHEQNVESLQSILGGQLSYAISQPFGVVVPYVRFEWNHEFRDNSRVLNAQLTADPLFDEPGRVLQARTNSTDRDYFGLNAGVSTVLEQGLQAFVNYKTVLDHAYIESHVFTLGLKMEF